MIDYLNKETYNFYLPEELIATNPNYKRDNCKFEFQVFFMMLRNCGFLFIYF